MRIIFSLFLFFNVVISFAQSITYAKPIVSPLMLQDSVVIETNEPDYESRLINQVFMLNDRIVVRFTKWDETGVHMIYKDNLGNAHQFLTTDSLIYTENAKLTAYKHGYLLPKYFGNAMVYFDTMRKTVDEVNIKNLKSGLRKYPNNTGRLLQNVGFANNNAFLHSATFIKASGSDQDLQTTLKNYYKKNKQLMIYDTASEKMVNRFFIFPEKYFQTSAYYANSRLFFVVSQEQKKVYISLQASHAVYVYDLNGNFLDSITISGKAINDQYLSGGEATKIGYVNKDYDNLTLDSYDNISVTGNYIFREYRTHYDAVSLSRLELGIRGESCPSPQLLKQWCELLLHKKPYLLRYNISNGEIVDFPFPGGCNAFIGYEPDTQTYLFKKESITEKQPQLNRVVIYRYKHL